MADQRYFLTYIAPHPIPQWKRLPAEVDRFRDLLSAFNDSPLFDEPPPDFDFAALSAHAEAFETTVMSTLAEVGSYSPGNRPLYELARCCSELKRRLARTGAIDSQILVALGEYRGLVSKNIVELDAVYLREHQP